MNRYQVYKCLVQVENDKFHGLLAFSKCGVYSHFIDRLSVFGNAAYDAYL